MMGVDVPGRKPVTMADDKPTYKALEARCRELERLLADAQFPHETAAHRKPESHGESENRYRTLLDIANDAVFVADAKSGTLVDANKRACALIGRSHGEVLGMHQSELHPPDQTGHYQQLFADSVAEGSHIKRAVVCTRDGQTVPVEISTSAPVHMGDREVVLGLFRDISEQVRNERALGEAMLRLEMAVSAADVGLWDWDLNTNQVHYSREWKRQIGYEEGEIPDDFAEWERRVHPDDLAPTMAEIRAALENRGPLLPGRVQISTQRRPLPLDSHTRLDSQRQRGQPRTHPGFSRGYHGSENARGAPA